MNKILMEVIDRIRRDEIISPSSSTRSSPEIIPADNEEAHARLAQLLSFDLSTDTNEIQQPTETNTQQPDSKDGNDDEEEEFEFRLFSAPKPTSSSTTKQDASTQKEGDEIKTQKLKIRLRSPTPVDVQPGDGRFIVPFRGWRYYFTKPELMHIPARDAEEKAQIEAEVFERRKEYEDVAVTGEEVLDWAKNMETPGCHLPWRVVRLDRKYHRVPKALLLETENKTKPTAVAVAEGEKKKSKPGKKRRIILRTRAAAKAAEKAKAEATSNMTEAEKRNKKNRERKIKRRQKEREKKAAMAAAAGTAMTTDSVGAMSVDGDSSD